MIPRPIPTGETLAPIDPAHGGGPASAAALDAARAGTSTAGVQVAPGAAS